MPKKYLGVGKDQGSTKIVSLANPTSPQDAATKAYVDALLIKATVGADVSCPISATTAFLTLAVPAGSVAVGDTFELQAFGVAATTPNIVLSMAVGASNPGTTQVWATVAIAPDTSAAGSFYKGLLTVKSVGSSGTVMGGGTAESRASAFANTQNVSSTNATQTVDTTAQWFVTARLTLTAASAVTIKSGFIRKV